MHSYAPQQSRRRPVRRPLRSVPILREERANASTVITLLERDLRNLLDQAADDTLRMLHTDSFTEAAEIVRSFPASTLLVSPTLAAVGKSLGELSMLIRRNLDH